MEFKTTLINQKEVASGTMAFSFEKPADFTFKAGQYLKITLINPPETDAEGNSRLFSITSAPHEKDIMITTRMRDTAFKRVLKTLSPGTEVTIQAPMGVLTLPAESSGQVVFIAGGIGITPFRSMILDAAYHKSPLQITLFYSDKTPADTAFLSELQEVQKTYPQFKLIPIMTRMAGKPQEWQGETGHIDGAMIQKYIQNISEPVYYIAGPPDLTETIRQTLLAANVPSGNIQFEKFVGY